MHDLSLAFDAFSSRRPPRLFLSHALAEVLSLSTQIISDAFEEIFKEVPPPTEEELKELEVVAAEREGKRGRREAEVGGGGGV